MKESIKSSSQSRRILFGTTVGMSAMALLRGQLAWFRERGWHVSLVTSPDTDAKLAAEREGVSLCGIPMTRHISFLNDFRSMKSWLSLIRRTRPHVINLGTPKASLLGGFAAWLCRVPRRIYTVRGLRLEGTTGLLARLLWLVERVTIAMATDVIAVSPSLAKELVARELTTPENVWIIGNGSSNGVDAQAIQARIEEVDRDRLRDELGINSDKFVVGYIGRVSSTKGIETLLAALKHADLTDRVELLVIGSIEDVTLGQAIEDLGDRSHVVSWTDDVWGYLPAIDALVLPTLREGFPNVVIEAAAAGIPSITTRATGAIDSVSDNNTGFLIDVGDEASLSYRISELANNPALRDRLGAQAKRQVETQFSPLEIWNGIEAIALGNHSSSKIRRLHELEEESFIVKF